VRRWRRILQGLAVFVRFATLYQLSRSHATVPITPIDTHAIDDDGRRRRNAMAMRWPVFSLDLVSEE
jgi:hypothetical protein